MLQMIEKAKDPAELRQLLAEQGLADDHVISFDDADLQNLLDKGLRMPEVLSIADLAVHLHSLLS